MQLIYGLKSTLLGIFLLGPFVVFGSSESRQNQAAADLSHDLSNRADYGQVEISVNNDREIINKIQGGSNNDLQTQIGVISSTVNPDPLIAPSNNVGANLNLQSNTVSNELPKFRSNIVPIDLVRKSWVIEKRQSDILKTGGHNFLVLRDEQGNIVSELHGLPIDPNSGALVKKGMRRNLLLNVKEFDHTKGEKSGRIDSGQPSAILMTADKNEILARWNAARSAGKHINTLNLPYPQGGFKLGGGTVNSNSVESTLSYVMRLDSPKLTYPLTIQDLEHAIEHDEKPQPHFLLTPGEGRIIDKNAMDGRFRYEANKTKEVVVR